MARWKVLHGFGVLLFAGTLVAVVYWPGVTSWSSNVNAIYLYLGLFWAGKKITRVAAQHHGGKPWPFRRLG